MKPQSAELLRHTEKKLMFGILSFLCTPLHVSLHFGCTACSTAPDIAPLRRRSGLFPSSHTAILVFTPPSDLLPPPLQEFHWCPAPLSLSDAAVPSTAAAMSWMMATAFVVGVSPATLGTVPPCRAGAVTTARPSGRSRLLWNPPLRATLQTDGSDADAAAPGAAVSSPPPAAAATAAPTPSAAAAASPEEKPTKKRSPRKSRRHTTPAADGSPRRALDALVAGQRLDGVVTNLVKHGAYVDVGTTTDGLVHLRDMSVEFVHEPEDILAPGDTVEVYVKYAEAVTGRLALSLLRPRPSVATPLPQAARGRTRLADVAVGSRVLGTVRRVSNFGAYVDVGAAMDGFVHVSLLYGRRPRRTLEELRLGQELWVVVDAVDVARSAIKLRARGRSSYNREQPLTATALSDSDERAAEAAFLAGFGRASKGGGEPNDPRQAVARPGEAAPAGGGEGTPALAEPEPTDPLSRFESSFGSDKE